ncbi:hypothetical protein GCM10009000_084480 [Halobacterium noricense]|uniref:DUF7260 domain-containing protein n=2 Tax=Haladaptatus pallidirubidus TaxID=1008152 RepID=A0AAV3URK4_9EURY
MREESRIKAEIHAFEDFLDRLNEDPPQPYRTDGGTKPTTLQTQTPTTTASLDAVQTAYQETVLAVDHWEEAYGKETTGESIANEFGPDVAAGLAGGVETWTSLLWNQLRAETTDSIETRRRCHQTVVAERQRIESLSDSLAVSGDELARIERADYPFDDRSDRLSAIQHQLEWLAEEEQEHLRQYERSKTDLLSTLVYADLDTDFPGLAAIATAQDIRDSIEVRHWGGMIQSNSANLPFQAREEIN